MPPNPVIADLIVGVANKERASFDALYRVASPKLFGVCLRVLKNRADAEDVLQDVFVKIWIKAERYAGSNENPTAWLIAVARNQAIDRLRANRRILLEIEASPDLPDTAPGPEDLLMADAKRLRIDACLKALGPDKAATIRGAYLAGDSYVELAQRHRVPLNTMRTWLRRGLLKLRQSLD